MGRDREGGVPERVVVGERLRVDDVEHGAQAAGFQLAEQRIGVDHAAATRVHEQRAVAHAGEQRGVEEPLGLRRERREQDDGVRLPDEGGQLVAAMHAVPGVACDAGDGDSEWLEPAPHRLADRPEPDDQHMAALELARGHLRPAAAVRGLELAVGVAEERPDDPLGHRRVARSACVAERRPRRHARLDPVRARGEHLQHAQPLEPRQRAERLAVVPVGQHEGRPLAPVRKLEHLHTRRRELDGDLVRARGDGGDHRRRTLAGQRPG